jgi:hypothetical protein
MRSKFFNVCDQVRRIVVQCLAQWRGAARAALVEDHDPIALWIEKAPMGRRRARARSAMQEDDGQAGR